MLPLRRLATASPAWPPGSHGRRRTPWWSQWRALAMAGREVLVVEAAPSFGTGTSSRNSEIIHAGVYYPPRSLKLFSSHVSAKEDE